ncbi:HU family DNA-binding protein [Parabacteroides faecis]|uniref:HU family DNA-binding protein n=1 Tax=Parabacteroides faecis TaxID=1217282 RepID=UPI002164B509|nr:HU family DNA-binding protein [Parabacteroides faecis]MCS2892284.1 HU family DNA-binding protein [Parabacteroides faecis]UVQ49077.1 HU family DNA-binding protein [Parabacteroides faecis]
MNKSDLIKSISNRTEYTETVCRNMVEALMAILAEELDEGNGIVLQGFGSFSPWHQTGRAGRNPRTGKTCMITPRISVKFKPGKLLLRKLNKK